MPDTRGLKEYILISVTNESTEMERRIHPTANTTIYNKAVNDNVTLTLLAISQCNMKSDMSEYLNLRKLLIYIYFAPMMIFYSNRH